MDRSDIQFTGRLASDPEIRITNSGHPIANFRVAVNRRIKDAETGEWRDAPATWWDVSAARELAANIEASLHSGDPVMVTGSVITDEWVDAKTQERRERKKVRADRVAVPLDKHRVTIERAEKRTEQNTAAE